MVQTSPDAEVRALLAYLEGQRHHVIEILNGLDDDALRRPMLPSGWTSLGLVNHLALDVERFWFRAVVAGEQDVIDQLQATPNPWEVDQSVSTESVFETYRNEIALANAIIECTVPDAPPAWWPGDLFGDFRLDTVREIILHVMTETAAHTGHLDVVRELIDRRQWLVLTE
ncbi:MAG: DinB family protein [Thermomicrobiales bacterium]|nr:DinB family protein [Thermomicrobiales bacterium]